MAKRSGDGRRRFSRLCECIFGPQLGRLSRMRFRSSLFDETQENIALGSGCLSGEIAERSVAASAFTCFALSLEPATPPPSMAEQRHDDFLLLLPSGHSSSDAMAACTGEERGFACSRCCPVCEREKRDGRRTNKRESCDRGQRERRARERSFFLFFFSSNRF